VSIRQKDMSAPDPPPVLRHQVLADPTGRRRRRLAIAGRVATTVLGLWLVVLILGGLGLQPLAGLSVIGRLGGGEAAPPALPARVQAAVAMHKTVGPAAGAGQGRLKRAPSTSRRSPLSPTSRAKRRRAARTTSPAPAGRIKPTPGRSRPTLGGKLGSPAPAPSLTATSPSSTAPGQARTETSPSSTAPGQTRTPPGQTRTEPGPPAGTPGTTPTSNGKAPAANTTVATP
jgi:hypothetical protein